MEIFEHSLSALFAQLGLPTEEEKITTFIELHRPLSDDIPLDQAYFWNISQSQFIKETMAEDSDWVEIIEQLDARLRE